MFGSFELLPSSIDTFPDAIFVKDFEHRWIAINQVFCKLIGHPYESLLGRSDTDFWPAEQAEIFWRGDDEVFQSGEAQESEELATGADGVTHPLWTRKFPMRDAGARSRGSPGSVSTSPPSEAASGKLDVDFHRVVTRGSLQSGLELARQRLSR